MSKGAVEKVLGEPFNGEFTGAATKVRSNLLVLFFIAIVVELSRRTACLMENAAAACEIARSAGQRAAGWALYVAAAPNTVRLLVAPYRSREET